MNTNGFQLAFIGLLFSVLAIWVVSFMGSNETAVEIKPPLTSRILCGCTSQLNISISQKGDIFYLGQSINTSDVVPTLETLLLNGWTDKVVIHGHSKVHSKYVLAVTDEIKKYFPHLPVVWSTQDA